MSTNEEKAPDQMCFKFIVFSQILGGDEGGDQGSNSVLL